MCRSHGFAAIKFLKNSAVFLSSQIYITIKGEEGKLVKRHLTRREGTNRNATVKYRRGATQDFTINDKDVGDVTSIVVEVNNFTEHKLVIKPRYYISMFMLGQNHETWSEVNDCNINCTK